MAGVATRGSGTDSGWVTLYFLTISIDGDGLEIDPNWDSEALAAASGKRFAGNSDYDSEAAHVFGHTLSARYVRLTMLEFVDLGGLRWAVMGCLFA